MPEEKDLFEENLSRLLRDAEEPPKMDPRRKEEVLRKLRSAFERAGPRDWRRLAMKRWVWGVSFGAAAAAAAVIAIAVGTSVPDGRRPGGEIAKPKHGPKDPGSRGRLPGQRDERPDRPRGVDVVALKGLAEDAGGVVRAKRVASRDLGGRDRYLTHVSTDKPIYKVGETVYVRGVILHARDNSPLARGQRAPATVVVKGPKGERVASGNVSSQDSVLGFSWKVPAGQAGGEHKVEITYPWHGHAPAERKFDIRSYRAPRLKSQIVFLRDGYGPGDRAGASLHVERAEGGAPAGAKVTATARVDGAEVARTNAFIDARGDCTVFFDLPDEIERGEGTLAMAIEDGGVVETATKTIPILLQTVDLVMYPEGGELVAGLPNRVYLEAKTPARKPADIAGAVVDRGGNIVGHFRTEHEGRGRFTFTPRAGEKYKLEINEPAGIGTMYPLPEVREWGVVLRALDERTPVGGAVRLGVGVTRERIVSVTLSRREEEIASARLNVRPPKVGDELALAEVTLTPPASASGVLVATVWDGDGTPLAERLVYREPANPLNVTVTADRLRHVPGAKAELTVRTTDAEGSPVSAVVGLAVTDDSVLEMIEKREQAPRLPVMVLLEDEVQELADAHVYLDPENEKAELALDLLLGTQGWRRFAFVDPAKLVASHGDDAKRLLAMRVQPPRSGIVGDLGVGTDARDALRRAVVLDPSNKEAAEKLAKVNDLLAVRMPSVRTRLEGLSREKKVRIQENMLRLERASEEGKKLAARAEKARARGDLDGAKRLHARAAEQQRRAAEIAKWMPSQIGLSGRERELEAEARRKMAEAEKLVGAGKFDDARDMLAKNEGKLRERIVRADPRARVQAEVIADIPVGGEGRVREARPKKRPAPSAVRPKNMERALEKADRKMAQAAILRPPGEPPAGPRAARELLLRTSRRQDFVPVRVYAHRVRAGRRPSDRVDFTETLYWNAGVRTNAKTGEAKVAFGLSDSVTTFRVFADGFSDSGALGTGKGGVESVEPFYIEPKLPLEVAAGDVVRIPLGIVNAMASTGVDPELEATLDGRRVRGSGGSFHLEPDTRVRRLITLRLGDELGARTLVVSGRAGAYSDTVTRGLTVKPVGFPVEFARGGVTDPGGPVTHSIDIPQDVVQGSVTTEIAVYPTPLANMTDSLKRLMREPRGCFEQTSSTTYPLVMAQQYFTTHTGVDQAIIRRSQGLLDKGYKRLTGFECKKKGYEWFGKDPGHEALTAFGLLEFSDMAKVREIDRKMVERTRAWLLAQRDGKGGFSRKRRALHRWIKDPDCSNAYVAWALLESGEKGLDTEVNALKAAAKKSPNSYVHALAANVFHLSGDRDEAKGLMARLVGNQTKAGWVDGAKTSIVGSGGNALKIETTSLAALAWMRDASFAANTQKAMKYLADSCKNGRYGSTQSTVLALRAIVEHDKLRARPKAGGKLALFIDGKRSGGWVEFDDKTQGVIALPDIGEVLEPGRHEVELRMEDGSAMPYSLAVNYHNATPASSKECKVALRVSLSDTTVEEGAVTEANVVVTNMSDEDVPTPVAIIGVPGGLEPRHDQLKELVKAERIAAYEVIGREVVLYWRGLEGGKRVELPISLVAAIPGTYTAPASRAYLYYTDEFKNWVRGTKVTITPRAAR